jgi:pantoate--beta-alanine ligase
MGALHEGHLSLVRHALRENDAVFVSIFVNPTQFGVHEDLDSYPKTWEEDIAKLKEVQNEAGPSARDKIRGIFAPTVQTMYPTLPPSSEIDGDGSFVTITPLAKWLEGASRPVFFRGVATVCTKLFNIVQPDRVYFGQKDIQQSVLIKRMVKDFHIPTEVRVIPTTREPSGLAMSSRNLYLGERRRNDAAILSRALMTSQKLYHSGVLSAAKICRAAFDVFESGLKKEGESFQGSGPIEIDYISLTRPDDMVLIKDDEDVDPRHGAILSAAMKVSPVSLPRNDEERRQIAVRLIDNVILEPRV